jgi:hypothetical protein
MTNQPKRLNSIALDANIAFNKLYDNSLTFAAIMTNESLAKLGVTDAGIIDCKHSNKRLILASIPQDPGKVRLVIGDLTTEEHIVEKETSMELISVHDVLEAMRKHFVH